MSGPERHASTVKTVRLASGEYVEWCGCGKPPDGKGFVVEYAEGSRKGHRALVHFTCIEPVDES